MAVRAFGGAAEGVKPKGRIGDTLDRMIERHVAATPRTRFQETTGPRA